MTSYLADNLIHFSRYLRSCGLAVVPETSMQMLDAVRSVGLAQGNDVYYAMRAVSTIRREDLPIFDQAFRLFFGEGLDIGPERSEGLEVHRGGAHRMLAPTALDATSDLEVAEQLGASAVERLGTRDFADLNANEKDEVRRLMARMLWQPPAVRSRRWGLGAGAGRPDMRATFRELSGPRGDLMRLRFSERRVRRRPVLVLADVSGSMERYVEMFLYFIHAARSRFGKLEAFVFSTRLTRITREMAMRQPEAALDRVSDMVQDWSGGTKIGEAFAEFNLKWARRVTRGGPIAIVISDGWDCGDVGVLAEETARLSRSVHRLIWLNPLSGAEGYEPLAGGMNAVLPYLDDFLPTANLAHLSSVIELIDALPPDGARLRRSFATTG